MKRWRVSYGFYVSVGLQGTSLMSIFQAVKELLFQPSRRSLRDWLILIWIVVGMIYTLSVPSLFSAATGYMVPTQSWWRMPDDVSLQLFSPVLFNFNKIKTLRISSRYWCLTWRMLLKLAGLWGMVPGSGCQIIPLFLDPASWHIITSSNSTRKDMFQMSLVKP